MTGYINLMRGVLTLCCFMMGTLWTQMNSGSPNHHMAGLTLIPTHKRRRLPFTKYTTQADGLASPTSLYLSLEHKEANTSFVFSHLDAIQFLQMKMTLQFIHIEGGFFSNKGGIRGKTRMVRGRIFMNSILLHVLMYKKIFS